MTLSYRNIVAFAYRRIANPPYGVRSGKSFAALAAASLALSACSAVPEPAVEPAPTPQVASGERCISIAAIASSRIIDDSTIDFQMRDGRMLRNSLPQACPSLRLEEAFTYSTSLSQLCASDIITVVQQAGGPRLGASCSLGTFTPRTAASE